MRRVVAARSRAGGFPKGGELLWPDAASAVAGVSRRPLFLRLEVNRVFEAGAPGAAPGLPDAAEARELRIARVEIEGPT